MTDLLELLLGMLELCIDLVDLAHRWRLCLSVLLGAGLAALLHAKIHHPKLGLAMMVCTGITALICGIGWEISAGK
jgi:hypothetical protein